MPYAYDELWYWEVGLPESGLREVGDDAAVGDCRPDMAEKFRGGGRWKPELGACRLAHGEELMSCGEPELVDARSRSASRHDCEQ